MKNAAEVVAATHLADGCGVGTDHAEQLAHLCALQIMRKQAQSIQSICTAAAVTTWTVYFGARSCSSCLTALMKSHRTLTAVCSMAVR